MTASTTKVQLGARVREFVRDGARARAAAAGVSLNEWVDRALAAALSDPHPAGRHIGQADGEGEAVEGGLPVAPRSGQTVRASAPQRARRSAAKKGTAQELAWKRQQAMNAAREKAKR